MEIIFNINHCVKVKLTDYGINHWLVEANKYAYSFQFTKDDLLKRMDSEGYYEFQLWDLMTIFSSILYLGNPKSPFVDNNIIFKAELSRKNKIEILLNGN